MRQHHRGSHHDEQHHHHQQRQQHWQINGSLFSRSGCRKYLNAAERRFVETALRMPSTIRLFCLTLRWSGARISEVLALSRPRSTSRAALRVSRLSNAASAGSCGRCPCRRKCFANLIACSSCGSRSGIRSLRLFEFGVGAARRRGATSRPSWRRRASPARPLCRRGCGTGST